MQPIRSGWHQKWPWRRQINEENYKNNPIYGKDRKNQNSWKGVMAISTQHKFVMTAGDNKKGR
jgi:hypothetical protein